MRLYDSLAKQDSEQEDKKTPEQLFFSTYFHNFFRRLHDNLPALLPQIYLHYDPINQKDRTEPILFRQRLDFLILLRNRSRVIIEIDGIHHYSKNKFASPELYAKMVAEDRRIRLLGYEIYRFGGEEFTKDTISTTIVDFFEKLFARHGIL